MCQLPVVQSEPSSVSGPGGHSELQIYHHFSTEKDKEKEKEKEREREGGRVIDLG